MPLVRVYIVRHGETEENRNSIIQGHLDTRLNADGLEQARRVGKALQAVPFDLAFSSDLTRAAKLQTTRELRERFLGELQGLTYSARQKAAGQSSVEPAEKMTARALGWWDETIVKHAAAAGGDSALNVLTVSHGGLIGHLVRGLVETKRAVVAKGVFIGKCMNTAVAIVEVGRVGPGVVVQYGDITHLLAEGDMDLVQANADE
ncbi:hypothetical protein HETIRDRAFT_308843 [Heterobasidion irregulare TC 32-1]|uniref:Phosphoglycerate mutase-like protein n=1 Tax=Heterobasidion irregulare (strain TC 32-1) TaxID=747525 RepID=W4KLA8_HETIT|nr:uncharacterized protein HETIRDRAFT_308843 [Heterobasidion irregulare TC 32-1]ETW86145.1 hypothetical protein HETIRDRAFT_308843 [Heterobasidion irregulare TC 32-1]